VGESDAFGRGPSRGRRLRMGSPSPNGRTHCSSSSRSRDQCLVWRVRTKRLPVSLQNFLTNPQILKYTYQSAGDTKRLGALGVDLEHKSWCDLAFTLAPMLGLNPQVGLARLGQYVLGLRPTESPPELSRSFSGSILTTNQVKYASQDALLTRRLGCWHLKHKGANNLPVVQVHVKWGTGQKTVLHVN
jgi:hypothetical protein